MKKQSIFVAISLALVALTAATASAEMWNGVEYDFVDEIDDWGLFGWDDAAVPIVEGCDFTYTHTIDGFVIPGEYLVTEAWLNLDFTNSDGLLGLEGDGYDPEGHWTWVGFVPVYVPAYDNREFVHFAYDGSAWVELGEDDGGQYDYDLYMDLDVLNNDGSLTVTVGVWNALGTADVWLDHSVLYGNVAPVPVPGAALLGILGLGAAGARLRKRS